VEDDKLCSRDLGDPRVGVFSAEHDLGGGLDQLLEHVADVEPVDLVDHGQVGQDAGGDRETVRTDSSVEGVHQLGLPGHQTMAFSAELPEVLRGCEALLHELEQRVPHRLAQTRLRHRRLGFSHDVFNVPDGLENDGAAKWEAMWKGGFLGSNVMVGTIRVVQRAGTRREQITTRLRESVVDFQELRHEFELTVSTLEEDLRHVDRSVRPRGERLEVEPARCIACDFRFTKGALHPPGRCPQCRERRIAGPWFRIR